MDKAEAQMNAIKLTQGDKMAEGKVGMDHEGKVHKCPACGHEMPMDEVMGHAGGYKLTEGQKGGSHMDHEGNLG